MRLRVRLLPLAGLGVLALLLVRAGDVATAMNQSGAADPVLIDNRGSAGYDRAATETAASAAKREQAIQLRERMADAAEKRAETRLAALRLRQDGARKAVPEQRQGLETLVKVYQAMRPRDAARIFERLEPAVQVGIALRMRERAMAAILAEMSPDTATKLTMALARHLTIETGADVARTG